MSEYDNGDIKLDIIEREINKLTQKREIKEQLSERVRKGLSWFDVYGSLAIAIIIVSILFITFLIMIFK